MPFFFFFYGSCGGIHEKRSYIRRRKIILMNSFRRIRGLLFGVRSGFSPVFPRQAEFLRIASRELLTMMESLDVAEWTKAEKDIKSLEVQGDALLAEYNRELSGKIVVVVNRIDLQALAMALDDCLDVVKDCAKAILIYQPEKIDQQLKDMAQLICSQADALKQMVSLMEDMRANYSAIDLQCDRVTELEHAADDAYEDYIGYIFSGEDNVKELIKYKNLAEVLESATDCAKAVSDTVRRILISYIADK